MEPQKRISKDNIIMTSHHKSFCKLPLIAILSLCTFILSPVFAQETEAPLVLTLDKAISMALEQNRDILIADQDRSMADAQIGEAWSGALPQLSINGSYTLNIQKPVLFIPANTPGINPTDQTLAIAIGSTNAYAMSASLTQPLYSRKIGLALQIASGYRDYTDQVFEATKETVIRDTKKSFYLVLLAQKLVEANRQGLEVVKANYQNVQLQYRNGTAAEFDMLRAEVQLANTEPLVISAENNLALSINGLKNLLAIPLNQKVVVDGEFKFEELPKAEMADAQNAALSTNPTIRSLSLQEDLLEKDVNVEKAGYFPSLDFVGGYSWQAQDNTLKFSNYNWAKMFDVGISLSIPLFDGFRTSNRVQEAEINLEKIHYTKVKAEEGLKIQIQSAELEMTEAAKRVAGQEQNINEAEKAVRISQTRFSNGVGTQLELLDAQVAMTRAQTNYAQAIYDYLVAEADWEYAVGSSK
jgi:outer membrane protein